MDTGKADFHDAIFRKCFDCAFIRTKCAAELREAIALRQLDPLPG